jgi:purine-binding chemotaxis protein CheW
MTETVAQNAVQKQSTAQGESKYLSFALANEEYGLEILKVREIIGYVEVTSVPQMPSYVKGVINLRGQVVPVVDLRARFGMQSMDITAETCIIVVETAAGGPGSHGTSNTGIIVDRVREVLAIPEQDIEPPPQFGAAVDTAFILGLGKTGERVTILLDIDRILGDEGMGF